MDETTTIDAVTHPITVFEKPIHDGYTIYSKTGCSYCEKAKTFLSNSEKPVKIINCDEYLETSRENFLKFMKKQIGHEYKTFPMIFDENSFVGGFIDLKLYFEKKAAFTDLSF